MVSADQSPRMTRVQGVNTVESCCKLLQPKLVIACNFRSDDKTYTFSSSFHDKKHTKVQKDFSVSFSTVSYLKFLLLLLSLSSIRHLQLIGSKMDQKLKFLLLSPGTLEVRRRLGRHLEGSWLVLKLFTNKGYNKGSFTVINIFTSVIKTVHIFNTPSPHLCSKSVQKILFPQTIINRDT